MLEILQFIFSDFWHWLGATIMLGVISGGLGSVRGLVSYRIEKHG